ncbi:MAG TPA: hypothetical protein VJ872_08650 [Nocardioides sp.]|nr:hypothetical protein [Nocardioides sp.]
MTLALALIDRAQAVVAADSLRLDLSGNSPTTSLATRTAASDHVVAVTAGVTGFPDADLADLAAEAVQLRDVTEAARYVMQRLGSRGRSVSPAYAEAAASGRVLASLLLAGVARRRPVLLRLDCSVRRRALVWRMSRRSPGARPVCVVAGLNHGRLRRYDTDVADGLDLRRALTRDLSSATGGRVDFAGVGTARALLLDALEHHDECALPHWWPARTPAALAPITTARIAF